MERMICQCCGEPLRKITDGYACAYCNAFYRDDQAEKAASLLQGILDDFKLEQLANARRRLYEATHEKYPSSQIVIQAASNVLSIRPEDFLARVYLHSHDADPYELILTLAKENVSEWEAQEALSWLIRSLDIRIVGAVKDFADRHLVGEKKTEALSRIEDEAFKLDSGVYDLALKRDVFLCYSAEDMPKVIEMLNLLEENGLYCFAAFRNLRHGKGAQENYQEAIFRAMKNCRVFVFLSSNSSRSPQRKGVAEELDHLITDFKNKPRVEFLLEDYPPRMPILAKRRLAEAFPHLEYCRDEDDLVLRVSSLLDAEENAEKEKARKIAEEAAEKAKKELQAEFEAKEAERRKKEQEREAILAKSAEEHARRQKELEDERLRLEQEKIELEKRKLQAEGMSNTPSSGAMDAESMLKIMEQVEELKRKKTQEKENKSRAKAVDSKIKEIGIVDFSKECKGSIEDARLAYDDLTEEQKNLVTNYEILLASEAELENLERQAKKQKDEEIAKTVESKIKVIGAVDINIKSWTLISEARQAYEALTPEQKEIVDNYDSLVAAEEKMKVLQAEAKALESIEASFRMRSAKNGTAEVIEYIGADEEVVIPLIYRNCPVKSISKKAFFNRGFVKTITIPDSVTSIGSSAFSGCSSLTSVTIPDSVTSIGESAFFGCKSLTSIVIPDSVTYISDSLFSHCSSLNTVRIGENVTSIDDSAFYGCGLLKSVNIPKSLTFIGECAFEGCSSLVSITIPNGIKTIKWRTFIDCASLTSVVIPASVTSIESAAFSGCSSLTSVTISSNVISIGKWAFSNLPKDCEIHFGHIKPLVGYPKGFMHGWNEGFKGKIFWGGK